MAKITLRYFKDDCMGCHGCEVACKQAHGLGVGPRLVRVIEDSPDFQPVYCRHCAKAPCLEGCPAEAIYRNGQGIVLIDPERCIGCMECLEACPFGAMQFDDESETAVKCDLCLDRLARGQAPACSSVCGTGAIFWGDSRQLAERIIL